jgi:hypothetical protein
MANVPTPCVVALCRHDELDLGRCEHFCRARTDCADADDRGAANCAVRGYSVIGSCATTLGVLATAFPDFAAVSTGCTRAVAMQLMFGLFAVLGLVTFPSAPALPGLAVSVTTTAAILFLERHLLGGLLSPLRAYALDRGH